MIFKVNSPINSMLATKFSILKFRADFEHYLTIKSCCWGGLNSSAPICRLIAPSFFQFGEDKRNDFVRVCGHKVIRAAKRDVIGK